MDNLKKIYLISITFAFIILTMLNSDAKDINGETPVKKRRIAILDFNANNTSRAQAKIVRNAAEVELYKTQVFEILERNQIDMILNEQGLQMSGCTDTSCAVEIGKLLSADMVVMGSLDKFKAYTINLKFVDISKGKVIHADSETADSEDNIRDAIKKLAKRAGEKMSEEYEVVVRKKKSDSILIWTSLGLHYALPLGDMGDLLNQGYGGKILIAAEYRNINAGIESGYLYFEGANDNTDKFTIIPIYLTLSYKYYSFDRFFIQPVLSAGVVYATLSYDKDGSTFYDKPEYTSESSLESAAKAGLNIGYMIYERIGFNIGAEYSSIFEKSKRMDYVLFNLSLNIGI